MGRPAGWMKAPDHPPRACLLSRDVTGWRGVPVDPYAPGVQLRLAKKAFDERGGTADASPVVIPQP